MGHLYSFIIKKCFENKFFPFATMIRNIIIYFGCLNNHVIIRINFKHNLNGALNIFLSSGSIICLTENIDWIFAKSENMMIKSDFCWPCTLRIRNWHSHVHLIGGWTDAHIVTQSFMI